MIRILVSSLFIFWLGLTNCIAATQTQLVADERLAPPLPQQQNIAQKGLGAEVLYAINKVELGQDGHWHSRSYVSVRVNDLDAARDYGRLVIAYNHYYSELELDFANSINSEGVISAVAKDAIQRRVTGGGQDFYSDRSELVFSLPDIKPGSVLEFQYSRKSKIIALPGLYATSATPHWFQSTAGNDSWRADFVHHYDFDISAPKNQPLYWQTQAGFDGKNTKRSRGAVTHYRWQLSDVAAIKAEDWMPPSKRIIPALTLSNQKDWSLVDAWTWHKVADKLAPSDKLRATAAQLGIAENASVDDKIRAVYAYLQNNVRYVFAHLGRGGYEPHFPDKVIDASYGDCKDQTVLALALLKQLGVEAYPALIETPNAGQSDTELVALIFDHMIVHISDARATLRWMDSTGDRALFPGVSNYLKGQNVLIVNGEGGKLINMPELGENRAELSAHYRRDQLKQVVDVEIKLSGSLEQNTRSWWTHNSDKKNALNQYMGSLFSNYDSMETQLLYSDELFKPVLIKATYSFTRDTEFDEYAASMAQMLRLFSSYSSLPLPESRRWPFYEPHGYSLGMHLNFEADKNYLPALVQSADTLATPWFTLDHHSEQQGQQLKLELDFRKNELDLSAADYRDYYQAVQALDQRPVWLVKMLEDSSNSFAEAAEPLPSAVRTAPGLIAQARALLEAGRFSEALNSAEQAVATQQQNGEAWYVLGLTQGFNSQIENSATSFAKAEDLGYQP
ncbi:DUF3857 and transglutaminase domain-containing protein [Agaribacterium haliotis]|uniref:DUF3857 and transglutaminase domain-containing protein n=1 Tax=Agaribacterium haliotis TaxID=2013869 RepID=UPI000BB58407|nr:DUF3857 and transglutaminase domain-containing protein [Agaribacterium haliotis]